MELLHHWLTVIVDIAILFFEYMGVAVLIFSGIKGSINYLRHDPSVRVNLARGMAMALEFKLGSEILRTVVVREYNEMIIVAGIILLRAGLTFLIHWEIKNEEGPRGALPTDQPHS